MKKVISYGALLLVVILGSSCMEEISTEFERVYYHPSYSIPVGSVQYSINDLVPEDTLDLADSDSNYTELIRYQFTEYEVPSEDYRHTFVVPADLSELSNKSEQVTSLMFRCNITNSIPVELGLQVYLMEEEQALEALLSGGGLTIGANEDRTEAFTEQQDIYIDDRSIDNILRTTHLGIELFFNSQVILNDTLQLFHTDSIHIQMGLRAALNVPL